MSIFWQMHPTSQQIPIKPNRYSDKYEQEEPKTNLDELIIKLNETLSWYSSLQS